MAPLPLLLIHHIYVSMAMFFPSFRNWMYRSYLKKVCGYELNSLKQYADAITTWDYNKDVLITVNLSFGDWLILHFMHSNLGGLRFRQFIREVAKTENLILHMKSEIEVAMDLAVCQNQFRRTRSSFLANSCYGCLAEL